MNKKLVIPAIIIPVILTALFFSFDNSQNSEIDMEKNLEENHEEILAEPDIIMPTKSSRPGCEETNSCYIPSTFSIKVGETVMWRNQDAAFHSVTSGSYDKPDEKFDSGHLDPDQSFSYTFFEEGEFDYFCTLHPWMEGKILVEN